MGLTHLLDTDICVFIIRRRPPGILSRFQQMNPGSVGISTVTVSELEFGVAKSLNPEKNQSALEQFLFSFTIVDYDSIAALHYGKIRAHLEKKGTPIGPLDTMIAAHARSLEITLVTNNLREFKRVPKLRVEDWLSS